VTLWAVLLVVVGLVLCVSGGNAHLAAGLGETPARSSRSSAAVGRFTWKLGLGMILAGVALFALSVVIHTVTAVLSVVLFGALIVGAFALLGRIRRSGVD
jgi:hypothetical protein